MKVLKLSAQGLPQSWISLEQAVIHYAAREVRWEVGREVAVFRGGYNAISGEQSIITVNSIIGTRGVPNINPFQLKPGLTNSKLFARDRNVCAYCGGAFHEEDLTREHIIPFAQN
ncbi:MAG: HNH endonuclease, partial [Burkholderiales bacterium]|nr:HNH endonuclease [Burkholderiales bacterium]